MYSNKPATKNPATAASQLGAVAKVGPQNAKLVDIDSDFDLDIVVDGKSPTTQVYLNDGAANFTLDDTVIDDSLVTSSILSTYETEFADVDGDGDFDAFLMNWDSSYFDTLLVNRMDEGILKLRPAPNAMAHP